MLKTLEPKGPSIINERREELLRYWSDLSDLYADKLHDAESAIVACRVAVSLDPSAKRRQRLATLCTSAGPAHLGEAIAQHQALLREEQARLASYRSLQELYTAGNRAGEAAACTIALACLVPGEAEPAERKLPSNDPRRALTGEEWGLLRHPDEDAELSALFATLAAGVIAIRAQGAKTALDRRKLAAGDEGKSWRALKRAAAAFGMPLPPVRIDRELAEPARVELYVESQRVVPVLAMGRPLVDEKRHEAELAFEIARRVAQLMPEHFLRWLVPLPAELAHLLEAAIALGTDEKRTGELGKTIDTLKRQLPSAALNQAAAIGHRLHARKIEPRPAALRWLQASDLSCARAAFAVVGDLPRCARAIKHDAAPATSLPAAQRILDLVWSSVTEELFAARKVLGTL
jgi:hypothetical protein